MPGSEKMEIRKMNGRAEMPEARSGENATLIPWVRSARTENSRDGSRLERMLETRTVHVVAIPRRASGTISTETAPLERKRTTESAFAERKFLGRPVR